MNAVFGQPKPVALWVRILAWVIVVASCVAAGGVIVQLVSGKSLGRSWYELVIFGVALAWTLPLFWIVALTGRAPRNWPGIASRLWRPK